MKCLPSNKEKKSLSQLGSGYQKKNASPQKLVKLLEVINSSLCWFGNIL